MHILKSTKEDKTILAVVKSQDGDYPWGQVTRRKHRGGASVVLAASFLIWVLVHLDALFGL